MEVPKEIVKNYLVSRFGDYYFELKLPSYIKDIKQIFKAGYRAGAKALNTPKHETVEELQKRLKEFAETISLFDSQADQCPECGIWRTEEMKEHMPNCTVNKINEWIS